MRRASTVAGSAGGVPALSRRAPEVLSPRRLVVRRFFRDRTAVLGLLVVLGMAVMAAAAPLVPSLDPSGQDLSLRRAPPGPGNPFGRDALGRDILARVAHGARYTLGAALLATTLAGLVGVPLGLSAGYRGGWSEGLIMRTTDVMLAFPYLLLAIIIVAILGPGLVSAAVAVGITRTPQYIRVVRGTALTVKQAEYVEAAQALGASDVRIVGRHLLPNVLAPIVVLATVGLGADVLSIAGLSFLGLGAQPPIPEWGLMVAEGRSYLFDAAHIIVAPGMFLLVLVLAFNLLGDGLRDALDPRLRR
ncbi:MAG: ABC transporter permease [Armatimonadetes bacterium]|nr:ABC transporter permease [Armatimonadota bacterium]